MGRAGAGCTGLVPRASVSSFNKGVAMRPLGCRAGFSTRRGPYCCKSGGLTQVPTWDTLASRGVSAGPAAHGPRAMQRARSAHKTCRHHVEVKSHLWV